MALLDLANYDILDLLPLSSFSEEEKGEYLSGFMQAYGGFLSEKVSGQMTDKHIQELESLFNDPYVTAKDMENFFKRIIPNYNEFLLLLGLQFKNEFLIGFYKMMVEEIKIDNKEDISYWEQLVKEAEVDNWEKVADVVKTIEQKYLTVDPTNQPPVISNQGQDNIVPPNPFRT